MPAQTINVTDDRKLSYPGRQFLQADQPLGRKSSPTATLLSGVPADGHYDADLDGFERIIEVRAALLDVLELVRTATPKDSNLLRLDATKEREARAALENAFEQIKRLKERLYSENL